MRKILLAVSLITSSLAFAGNPDISGNILAKEQIPFLKLTIKAL